VRNPAPVGVGINLQPSAVRELTELGLGDDLARTGIALERLSYYNKLGQLIWNERYDCERRPVMSEITLPNRRFGPEAAMQLVEERAPDGFDRVEDAIASDELEAIAASFSSAAGLDVQTVNRRPSFVPLVRSSPGQATRGPGL
jgi:hypothetical protein